MKTQFNLVTDDWLPVVGHDGKVQRVGLARAFEEGTKFRDLHVAPHERIALMRLLICVAQRALAGPADYKASSKLRTNLNTRLAKPCTAFLRSAKIKRLFDFLGTGHRFLQTQARKTKEVSIHKLQLVDEHGSTVFDQHLMPGSALGPAEAAVALVTFQSFAAGGRVEGCAESQPGGICREKSAMHTFVIGQNLLETLSLNLLTLEQLKDYQPMTWNRRDRPVWELAGLPLSRHKKIGAKTAGTYLARLVPLARSVWLGEALATVHLGQGIKYPLFDKGKVRDPFSTLVTGMDGKDALLSARAERAIWRDVHAITVIRRAGKRAGPAVMESALKVGLPSITIWCGALVGGGAGRAAKVNDIIEAQFVLPRNVLAADDSLPASGSRDSVSASLNANAVYRAGVGFSEMWEGRLKSALRAYRREIEDPKKRRRKLDKRELNRLGRIQSIACLRFWALLEPKASTVLIPLACDSAPYMKGGKVDWPSSPWGQAVLAAVREAFAHACPHDTPEQLRAYAAGLHALFTEKSEASKNSEIKTESEEDA